MSLKPKTGKPNCTTWTAEEDEAIMSMIMGGSTYAKIASALGKGK